MDTAEGTARTLRAPHPDAGARGDVERSPATTRVVYLDNLRILLTVLVVLHHIAAGYGDLGVWYYSEPVSGPGSLLAFTTLLAIDQSFFMGAFFLLAGYFVPPSLERKGARGFLRDRLLRLGVPLAVFVVAINPLAMRLAGHGWEMGPGPMWFVEVLLLFTLGYLAVRPFLPRLDPIPIDGTSTAVLASVMAAGSFLVRTAYPVNEWLPLPTVQPAHATQYLCLFAVGVWASGVDLGAALSAGLTRRWRRAMLVASVAVAAAFVSVDVPGDGKIDLAPLVGGWTWQSFVTASWEQVFAVGIIVNLLALFHRRANTSGPIRAAAAAAAYTVYIVHPVVLVLIAQALRDVPIPSIAKFAVAAPIAVVILFASAHQLRRAPLLRAVL